MEHIRDHLGTYEGLFDISDSLDTAREEIQLSIKPEAEQFGLTLSSLAQQVRQAFYGEELQRINRGRDDVRIMLRYPQSERHSLQSLEQMYIRTPDGKEIPFSTVAEVTIGESFPRISRIDRNRTVNIRADADKTNVDIPNVRASISSFLDEELRAYPGVRYTFEGEAKEERENARTARIGWTILVFGIYAMLAIPFRSYIQPLIVMSVIPFGIIGAVIGHIFEGWRRKSGVLLLRAWCVGSWWRRLGWSQAWSSPGVKSGSTRWA